MTIKKPLALVELTIIVLSVFSFSYLISSDSVKVVSASEGLSGCCLETRDGAICQNIPFSQSNFCTSPLIGTGCDVVDQCRLGCCYSPNTGTCAMRAPKDQCLSNGGNWSNDASCNIPSCQLGCCVMGDQVTLTNSRECTLLSNKFNFEKNFFQIGQGESCDKYTGLERQGACLTDSGDYSGENKCTFTTKKNCKGDFREGYLCTSQELNTICQKTKKTTCVDGKDQVYFLDSCGNVANIYDATKVDDQTYWERPIDPVDSCKVSGTGCGNCDYIGGSICSPYEPGKTLRPSYGDYVCKNLNCGERKHGESWCIYDVNPNSGISPVGSRSFVASCFEGDISLEGCADFNQEICAQSTDTSFGFTEAKCLNNDWRACINANDADSYAEVKVKCDENPQCIMFNELYGEDRLKRSDGSFFAGFDPERDNSEQGAIDSLGREQNKVLAHCVPRFTPGFQFWSSSESPINSKSSKGGKESTINYGGSVDETAAICSLGSFTCVSQIHRTCYLLRDCEDWRDHELNWECNYNGVNDQISGRDLPNLLAALNERCRALGSCGVSSNLLGEINTNSSGFSVQRIKLDRKGKTREKFDVSAYVLSQGYLDSIKRTTTSVKKLNQLSSNLEGLTAESLDGVGTAGNPSSSVVNLKDLISQANIGSSSDSFSEVLEIVGPISLGALTLGWSSLTRAAIPKGEFLREGARVENVPSGTELFKTSGGGFQKYPLTLGDKFMAGLKSIGISVGFAIVGAYAGGQIGRLIAKNQDWSPGKMQQFTKLMSGIGSTLSVVGGSFLTHSATIASANAAVSAATTALEGATAALTAAKAGTDTAAITAAESALATAKTNLAAAESALTAAEAAPVLGTVGTLALIAAIIYMAYVAFWEDFEEQEYFVLNYNCGSWQPPKQGNCEFCNDDVRPCSEYRCKSLGSKCHYFVENGEPGYCATINEIWSAQIKPWDEILSPGNQYTSVKNNGFKIQGSLGQGVEAWSSLTFGITTDKPAQCRIDFEHTKDYSDMKYEMDSTINLDTGKADGTHHSITLNPYVGSEISPTTLGLVQGEENEYYIRCMNFAGQVNEAEFVVQVKAKEGPDLTPPNLVRFSPTSNSYLSQGTNSTELVLYLNEPAECRFDYEYDAPSGPEYFEELRNQMFCLTDKSAALYGEWRCFTKLENLTVGQNNLYFRCKDQPDLEETENYPRNVNFVSTNYQLNVCSSGLEISLLNQNTLIEEKNFTLSVSTSGCLGDAVCSFRMINYSDSYTVFFETGKKIHNQMLTLPQGNHSIEVSCEDEAKNKANQTFNFSVYFDDVAPQISRVMNLQKKAEIITDEEAECRYETNKSLGCLFEFPSDELTYLSKKHNFDYNPLETYFIKCRDKKLNVPQTCSVIVKPL